MELSELTSATSGAGEVVPRNQSEADIFADDAMAFINLFLVQLQNQDPLDPQETHQMTEQLAGLALVQESQNQGGQLDELIELNKQNGNSDLISLVGKRVEVDGEYVRLSDTGNVRITYELEESYANAFVTIADPVSGDTLFTGEAIKTAGKNSLEWDGTDNNGNRVPPGDYYVRVDVGTENQEQLFQVPTLVLGDVEGVLIDNENGSKVIVNGGEVKLSDIKYVAAPISGVVANNNQEIN